MRTTRRWLVPAVVLVAWLALGSLAGPFAGRLAEVSENDAAGFLPASAESTQVAELQRLFSDRQGIPAVVVAQRADGLTAADRDHLTRAADKASALGEVSPVLPSDDGAAARVIVALTPAQEPAESVAALRKAVGEGAPPGLTVLVTGPAAQGADLGEAFGGIDGLLLLVAGAVVAVILVVVYRSPLLPLFVLLSAVFALGVASLVVYLLADNDVLALNGQSQGILFILVFGAATDYALLLVARYREELRNADKYTATARAWRATIQPIAASAGTVILGVLCLLFSDLNSNRGLGPVAAIGIAAALVSAMTFLPAVLALAGRAAFWPFSPKPDAPSDGGGFWGKVASRVGRAPRAIWIATSLALLALAAFFPQLKASGTAQSDIFLTPVESVAGQELLSRHFPGGTGAPTVVVARAEHGEAVTRAARVDGVADARITGQAQGLVRVEAVLSDPAGSEAAVATVQRLREAVHAVPGAEAKAGGPTAQLLDTQQTSERDRQVIIPIVLVVIFAVLALLLRSLLAPLMLIATVVLSFAATMGVSALVFNHVLGFPGADPVVPLFGFVFLVALGIDYNIFLMTRVREEAAAHGTRDGTLRGLRLTGAVITSAGVVLAATFAALAVLPILFLAQIAFIVAFGVLLDTLVVRSLLVPALTLDIGRRVWWPSALSRRNAEQAE
ncbi:MMPL family transporter [Actinokineospora sp. UTMC 2448]|uniref:MMPL family transporter n=1 Tax=Actinokineospora sp. UTMC 2448 TaxID=2268449 RepID=UPI0021643924|nr:MMPL family transporter [Actinokineospora sp. UTMC 2448]UVS79177.1 Putative membrane protein YdgH [Actinokineospora sp. UTMC 2448]